MNQILRHVGEIMKYESDSQLEELYTKTAWYFDKKLNRPGYGAHEVFKNSVRSVMFEIFISHLSLLFHQYDSLK